jgi:hypothetical protein
MKALTKAKFAAVQFAGRNTYVSGIGQTQAAAISDAKKYTDVSAGLRVVPMTKAAKESVERRGGDARNKAVTLVLITRAELEALELQRRLSARLES